MDGSGGPGQALDEVRLGRRDHAASASDDHRGHTAPEEALIRRLTRERLLVRDRGGLVSEPGMPGWPFEVAAAAE